MWKLSREGVQRDKESEHCHVFVSSCCGFRQRIFNREEPLSPNDEKWFSVVVLLFTSDRAGFCAEVLELEDVRGFISTKVELVSYVAQRSPRGIWSIHSIVRHVQLRVWSAVIHCSSLLWLGNEKCLFHLNVLFQLDSKKRRSKLICLVSRSGSPCDFLPLHSATRLRPRQVQLHLHSLLRSFAPKLLRIVTYFLPDKMMDMTSLTQYVSMSESTNPYTGVDPNLVKLSAFLAPLREIDVMLHFLGRPLPGAPFSLDEAVIVSLNLEWWQKEPHPTTEIGIAELHPVGKIPTTHAENILTEIWVAHARIAENAHLVNRFQGAGDPEKFHFGTTMFVKMEEAKKVLINTFCRQRANALGQMQPIILLAHDAEGKFNHIKEQMNIDVLGLNTVIKVIDTQMLAAQAGISGPKGPTISLAHLVDHFNIKPDNLHTAGNDAGYTMITAVLTSLKNDLYGHLSFAQAFGSPPPTVDGLNITQVINKVKKIGKSTAPPPWGRLLYCTRCDRSNHLREKCFAKLSCDICRNSGNFRLERTAGTHMASKCVFQYMPLPQVFKPKHITTGVYSHKVWVNPNLGMGEHGQEQANIKQEYNEQDNMQGYNEQEDTMQQ
jgi:hypothetical protein